GWVAGGGGEGGTSAGRVREAIDVLEEAQPCRLEDVSGVALHQLEITGDRPYQPGVLVNQTLPRPVVTLGGAPHQQRDVWRPRILLWCPGCCGMADIGCGRSLEAAASP